MHSIHGRALAIASGLKISRPDLSVWVVTGDGDSLSIGGNHLIHCLRRNPDLNILLFNNQVYGLTKGQASPTSVKGQLTKSTPGGNFDPSFNPLSLCLGAGAGFYARTMDRDLKHQQEIYLAAYKHKGASLVEIYQNCNVFNDGAFSLFTDKDTKAGHALFLLEGEPLFYGNDREFVICLNDQKPVIKKTSEASEENMWVHDPSDKIKALILAEFQNMNGFPRPFGIIYENKREVFEDQYLNCQTVIPGEQKEQLKNLLKGKNSWEVR
jgi:2-oxoglutarate ferredoxin oxidoreductase subunit beta